MTALYNLKLYLWQQNVCSPQVKRVQVCTFLGSLNPAESVLGYNFYVLMFFFTYLYVHVILNL